MIMYKTKFNSNIFIFQIYSLLTLLLPSSLSLLSRAIRFDSLFANIIQVFFLIRGLPARDRSLRGWTRGQDHRLGGGGRRPLLAGRQLLEHGLGGRGLLQDPEG